MLDQSKENIERHIKTHIERSDDDLSGRLSFGNISSFKR